LIANLHPPYIPGYALLRWVEKESRYPDSVTPSEQFPESPKASLFNISKRGKLRLVSFTQQSNRPTRDFVY